MDNGGIKDEYEVEVNGFATSIIEYECCMNNFI